MLLFLVTEKPVLVSVYKGGDRSLVSNYRPVSLTPVVSKQMGHIIPTYLREVLDKDWVFEGQDGSDFGAKVKFLRFVRTLQTPWIKEVGQMLL
jgi:hypothetical protein